MRTLVKRLLIGLFGLATLAGGAVLYHACPDAQWGVYTGLVGVAGLLAALWPDQS